MERKIKNIIICTLVVILVFMTVAYALLFQNLSINGTANIPRGSSTWNIYFDNLNLLNVSGTASIESGKNLQITGTTTLSGLTATLSAKGDSISYTFDIVNDGDINAKIGNISLPNVNSAVTYAETSADEQIVKPNIIYSLKYTSSGTDLSINDTLNAHTSVNVTFTVSYNSSASNIPNNDVYLDDLIAEIDYIQS